MLEKNSSVIVSWDLSDGRDDDILLVGKQKNGKVDVINAIKGESVRDILHTLIDRSDVKNVLNDEKECK